LNDELKNHEPAKRKEIQLFFFHLLFQPIVSLYLQPLNKKLIVVAKKGNRVQVIMECTEHKTSGVPGTSRYITTKNKKNTTERLELKKFNPVLKRVTVHKEIK
jgi:large subunit ribosomal protein L33